jgi:hypothetical protein
MPNLYETNPKKAAQATKANMARVRRVSQPKSGYKPSRTQTSAEQTREFQTLLLDDKFPRLLDSVSQSLEKLTSPLDVDGINRNNLSSVKKNLKFANYNSIYLSLKAARSRFRKFARNKSTATDREKKLFYIKAIQILPTLKKIASLQAPKLRSFDEAPFLTKDSFLFDFVIADSQHQNPSVENALKQVQNPILLVGGNIDELRYGLNQSDGKFAWKIFDEKFKNHHEDLQFKIEQVKEGKPSKAKELAGLSTLEIAALSALEIEEKAFHRTLDELVLEPIKTLAQSTYLELNKAIGNRTRLLCQMTDLDINSEISRYQLSSKEKRMSTQELLARNTRDEDQDIPEIAVEMKGVKASRVKPNLKNLLESRVLLKPLETLINLQKLIQESLMRKTESYKEQICQDVLFQIEHIDKNEVLTMTLPENERAYKILIQIAATLNANGLNNKKVHDALSNLITINSQAIYHKGNQKPDSQALSSDAVRQEIEEQNVFQVLNTSLDKMIDLASTWTLPNLNLADSLREISKGKNEFKFSVLKKTKFSNKELEILQEKIRHVISFVPQASHSHSLITNLIEMDKIMSNQLIKSTSEAIRRGNDITQTRQKEVTRSDDNLPKVRNPLGEWRDAIYQLQKVVSRKIELVKERLEPLLNKIVRFSRYKKVQEKVPFQLIEDQIFEAYNVFSQRNFNKIPKQDYLRIQDLFLSTAVKLDEMHNPKLAA